jgi:hypothetical protein
MGMAAEILSALSTAALKAGARIERGARSGDVAVA